MGQQIGQRGMAKLTYTNRSYYNFIEDFIDNPTASGRTDVVVNGTDFGTFDNIVYRNSDLPERNYQALLFQANYRPWSRLSVDGHWTVQLKNEGNFEGEAQNQPGISSSLGDYPEILVPSRNFPIGRLNGFQRNKVRLWAIYNQPLGRFGSVDVAPILRVDSGTAYSLFATDVDFSDVQLARDPGYAHLPDGGHADPLLRRARGADVPRFRAAGSGGDVSDPGVQDGQPVGQGGDPESDEQPEADLVGHDGHP